MRTIICVPTDCSHLCSQNTFAATAVHAEAPLGKSLEMLQCGRPQHGDKGMANRGSCKGTLLSRMEKHGRGCQGSGRASMPPRRDISHILYPSLAHSHSSPHSVSGVLSLHTPLFSSDQTYPPVMSKPVIKALLALAPDALSVPNYQGADSCVQV